jgi:hypothetical protein
MLPFSYVIENNGESFLVPGINLRNVGTIRDAQKWPQRDKRKDHDIIDQINFNLLNPFTIRKMIDGKDLLMKLQKESEAEADFFSYNDIKITRHSLERGIILYQIGIDKFLGRSIIKRLEGTDFKNSEELSKKLAVNNNQGDGEWIDLAGMIVPKNEVEKLLNDIEAGKIQSLETLSTIFEHMHNSYADWEWKWAAARIEEVTGKSLKQLKPDDVIRLVEKWKRSVIDLDTQLCEDAGKEFSLSSMTGYGIDGGKNEKLLDFKQVRGDFESNIFVNAIRNHIKQKSALGDELIERMKKIR